VRSLLLGGLIAGLTASSAVAADGPLDEAKNLYAAASFEDALAAIAKVDAARSADPEVLLYKSLCLLALGRGQEAGVAVKTLVTTAPTYAPNTGDFPPRFQALWAETRKAALPPLAKDLFSSARTRYQGKDYLGALQQFQQVMTLTDDPVWKDAPEAADLKTLASGFIDLSQAAIPKPDPGPPVTAVAPPPPPPVRQEPVIVEPAVALSQTLPRWTPPSRAFAQQSYDGAIKVSIDETGKVTAAEMVRPTHPSYDPVLLRAARGWTYRPATRNGTPIASEKTVDVHLGAAAQ
jgi:tetratricopeptide (TPR) repeat protein